MASATFKTPASPFRSLGTSSHTNLICDGTLPIIVLDDNDSQDATTWLIINSFSSDDLKLTLYMESKFGLLGRSVNSDDSKLALDELPSNVQCFKFQFSFKTSITGGTIDKKEVMNADDLAGLEDIFENCQECKEVGVVLRLLEYTIACAHSYSMWYIIDSHARDSTKMIDDQGSSVVLQFPDYLSLFHYIRCFFEQATSERVINQNDLSFKTMTLQIRERNPVHSDERLILSIQSLMTYCTSLGGIDLMNTFATCLENGKEVNDDLLDFFLLFTAETHLNHIMKK